MVRHPAKLEGVPRCVFYPYGVAWFAPCTERAGSASYERQFKVIFRASRGTSKERVTMVTLQGGRSKRVHTAFFDHPRTCIVERWKLGEKRVSKRQKGTLLHAFLEDSKNAFKNVIAVHACCALKRKIIRNNGRFLAISTFYSSNRSPNSLRWKNNFSHQSSAGKLFIRGSYFPPQSTRVP
jgi:hypothetical protein